MINPFQVGDTLEYRHIVSKEDIASFKSGNVHEVYSTFALTRDAEWSGRLFVLKMKEDHEEGIGTYISTTHASPALVGQEVIFTSALIAINGNEVVTSYEAVADGRLIAKGEQKQKILPKEKLDSIFNKLVT